METKYDVEVLLDMAGTYLTIAQDYYSHIHTRDAATRRASQTAKMCYDFFLNESCKMVKASPSAVLTLRKAINRHERRQCPLLPIRGEMANKVRCYLAI